MSRTAVTGSTNVEILSSEIRDRHNTQGNTLTTFRFLYTIRIYCTLYTMCRHMLPCSCSIRVGRKRKHSLRMPCMLGQLRISMSRGNAPGTSVT